MKIIDGKGAILGRLSSYVAKEALKGEEIAVVNCEEIIILGNKQDIKKKMEERRKRVGSGQKGPKVSRLSEKIVKRAIRGMLPNHRRGRGKECLKKIKCYKGVPDEFKDKEMISLKSPEKRKYTKIKEISIDN